MTSPLSSPAIPAGPPLPVTPPTDNCPVLAQGSLHEQVWLGPWDPGEHSEEANAKEVSHLQ